MTKVMSIKRTAQTRGSKYSKEHAQGARQRKPRRRWIVGYSIGWPRPHMFVHVKIESTEKMKMALKNVFSKEKRTFLKRRPVVVFVLSIF
jgi:hypothetical protein